MIVTLQLSGALEELEAAVLVLVVVAVVVVVFGREGTGPIDE